MKFTSILVLVALFAESDVNAIQMHNSFIDQSNVLVRDDVPTAEKKEAALKASKDADAALEKSKNETAKAKMVGEKMKAAKEKADEYAAKKAADANAAKEAETEAGIKRNQQMLDANKA